MRNDYPDYADERSTSVYSLVECAYRTSLDAAERRKRIQLAAAAQKVRSAASEPPGYWAPDDDRAAIAAVAQVVFDAAAAAAVDRALQVKAVVDEIDWSDADEDDWGWAAEQLELLVNDPLDGSCSLEQDALGMVLDALRNRPMRPARMVPVEELDARWDDLLLDDDLAKDDTPKGA